MCNVQFITRYRDDTVEIYEEGTEIQLLYFWRTTDELNVSRLVLQNINRPGLSGLRTTDFGLWNTNLEHGTECLAD